MIDFVTSWMSRLLVKPCIARTDQPKDVSIAASQAVVIGNSRGIAGERRDG